MRHYVYPAGRRVHYRRSGSGPPIVVVPPFPQSSASCPIDGFAGHTVLVIDSPGYGDSDPIEVSTVDGYAAALADTIAALRLPCVELIGVGSGGAVAIALADGWPDRVRRLVLRDLVIPDATEINDLEAEALPSIAPRWDGAHLLSAWFRQRDSHTFRPWYRRGVANRIEEPLPGVIHLHAEVMDLLRADVAYAAGDRAVDFFKRRPHVSPVVPRGRTAAQNYPTQDRLPLPVLHVATPHDPPRPNLERAAALTPRGITRVVPGRSADLAATLSRLPVKGSVLVFVGRASLPDSPWAIARFFEVRAIAHGESGRDARPTKTRTLPFTGNLLGDLSRISR